MAGLTKTIARLIQAGFPEGTAYKIATGELDMSNAARMQRASEQEFGSRVYYRGDTKHHGALESRRAPKDEQMGLLGTHVAESPGFASRYAEGVGGNVSPVYVRGGNQLDASALTYRGGDEEKILSDMMKGGGRKPYWSSEDYDFELNKPIGREMSHPIQNAIDSVSAKKAERVLDSHNVDSVIYDARYVNQDIGGSYIIDESKAQLVRDPSNIRSVNAAFDPDNVGKNTLLGSARPDLLAAMGLGTAGALAAPVAYNALQEQQHGVLAAPEHPNVLRAADALRGLSRRLEGSPAGILAPDATAEWLGKLAYKQKPTWMDRISAIGDWL